MGQNKVAYRKSASYVAWKCLKSSCVVASYPLLSLTPTPVEVELGCDNFRFLSPLCLEQYWEGLGVADGSQVLEDLGLSAAEERLDLRIVSQKLNDEIGQALEIVRYC